MHHCACAIPFHSITFHSNLKQINKVAAQDSVDRSVVASHLPRHHPDSPAL